MHVGPGVRVLVTGASRGIGRALAEAFADRGCTLGLVSRSPDKVATLARGLHGGPHEALPADVGDPEAIASAVRAFGDCDIAVANAGVAYYGHFATMDAEKSREMTRTNWLGTVYTIGAVLPRMLNRHRGHLVVVSSTAAFRSFPQAAVYGGTKAAQQAFADALRHELHDTGVSVTTVYPGEVTTQLHDHEKDSMPDWYHGEHAAPTQPLAELIVHAVERDNAVVYYPQALRLLRIAQGVSPRFADAVLRRLRGPSAAPRYR